MYLDIMQPMLVMMVLVVVVIFSVSLIFQRYHSAGEGKKVQYTPVGQEPETVRSESKSVQVHRKETKTTPGYLTKDGRIVGVDGEVLYSEKHRQEADNAENTRVLKREEVKAAIQKARAAQDAGSEKEEKTGGTQGEWLPPP